MPINKADYPPNWTEISNQVKEEASWMCEWCGVPHKAIIRRGLYDPAGWIEVQQVYSEDAINFNGGPPGGWEPTAGMDAQRLKFHGLTKIILTTAHLDRNTKNNARKNLAALCQRCHLSHDVLQHVANRKYGRLHAKDHQQKLQI